MAGRTVLVTGVSRQLGASVAVALARDPGVDAVIGLDAGAAGSGPLADAGVQLIRADLRSPTVVRLVDEVAADTVVHMGVVTDPATVGGRTPMKEINVIGTMHLLAACRKAPGLRRLVVRSSAGVYGAGPGDPALFAEDTDPTSPPQHGWARDCVDVEASVRSFARRHRTVDVAVLRLAHAIGPALRTGFTDLLTQPAVPAVLGHDGRLQFVHADDVVGAVLAATLGRATGEINVAGAGVVTVSQAAALAGRAVLPVPAAVLSRVGRLPGGISTAQLSEDDIAVLSYGRVLDTTRMERDLGYRCRFTTRQALEDMVAARALRTSGPRPLARGWQALSRTVAPLVEAAARTGQARR